MNLKHLFFTLFLWFGVNAYAQDPVVDLFKKNISSPYDNFFKQKRERIYVHLNRSEYLAGDNIWFKAYVYDAKATQLMIETNKLYAELFDQSGKLIERKTLFINNGVGNSFFKLNDNLKSGTFTIRAYTNWMRNFKDQPVFSHEFKVQSIGLSEQIARSASMNVILDPDLQIFPEGGMFVEGIDNHFGVKLTLPNGQGTASKGYLIGLKNDTLETFTTNHLGFGDFTISDAKKIKYKISIEYQGNKHKEITISEPLEKGIGMTVNTILPSKVIIAVNTNLQTATDFKDKNVFMVVHNNGTIYKSSYLRITKDGFVSTVNKSLLGPGVNYITIFDSDFKPLAERLIFNNSHTVRGIVDIKHSLQNDSLSIDVNTTGRDNMGDEASLSFSMLPAKTVGNNFSNSLFTDLLLNSAIKGNIESSNYYTESDDLKHQKDLDNLLLTQGWRRYEWSDILMEKIPEERYPFEHGFTINAISANLFKGKGEKNSTISLFSPQNNLTLLNDVDETGHALFSDLYLIDSSLVVLSATNLKGSGTNRNLKASVSYLKLDSIISIQKIQVEKDTAPTLEITSPLIKMIELNEVVVSAKEINPFTDDIYSSIFDKVYLITEKNYYKYNSIESLLQGEFFLQARNNTRGIMQINMNRGISGIGPGLSYNAPALIVDGFIMEDLELLSMINISDIEAIAVNKMGSAMLGSRGSNGSINIITRKKSVSWAESEYNNSRKLLVNGYEKNIEFFTPRYILSPESDTYQKYASIYWNPAVDTDSTGNARFKFAVPKELKEFTIRTEGMSQNGIVYYDERKISIKPEL